MGFFGLKLCLGKLTFTEHLVVYFCVKGFVLVRSADVRDQAIVGEGDVGEGEGEGGEDGGWIFSGKGVGVSGVVVAGV